MTHTPTVRPLRVLQVNTFDSVGGAARIARNLFEAYRARGHGSWLAVGNRQLEDGDVIAIPRDGAIGSLFRAIPKRIELELGIEDFRFPASRRLLEITPEPPDVLHAHNLHGGYFDLRALRSLSSRLPVVLTLHDAWLLSGHCGHSIECERWKVGCGQCPDLTLDPPVRRDATAYNWRRKREIFGGSRLHVATPCRWLMDKVDQSILATATLDARVIPNGVDLTVFRPGASAAARESLDLPMDASVVLFSGYALRRNAWKDYETVRRAIGIAADRLPPGRPLVFVALGDAAATERIGAAEARFIPYQDDTGTVARYYQAADLYVHASRAETFPNTILEAMACGTPVVATAVGGVPEQIEDGRTGLLVPAGDASALAEGMLGLLQDKSTSEAMGRRAAEVAARRFDLQRQADAYLDWYREMVEADATASVLRGSDAQPTTG